MIKKIVFLCSLLLLFTSCVNNSIILNIPTETLSATETTSIESEIRLESGKGTITGKINRPEFWKGYLLYAYAAPYLGDPKGEGIYILDDKLNEYAKITENNSFKIINVPPGIYILVVGPDVETAMAYRKDGVAIKISVSADLTSEIGEVVLEY